MPSRSRSPCSFVVFFSPLQFEKWLTLHTSPLSRMSLNAVAHVEMSQSGCRQCQRLNPVLDYLESRWEREAADLSVERAFTLAKVDVENNPRLASVSQPPLLAPPLVVLGIVS